MASTEVTIADVRRAAQTAKRQTVNYTPNGNTPGAQAFAEEVQAMVRAYCAQDARSVQRHVGPSELGAGCSRKVVAKMAAAHDHAPRIHTSNDDDRDPYPSFKGRQMHDGMEKVAEHHNKTTGTPRFITETRVYPDDLHPGTMDLWDERDQAVGDWKFVADTTLAKIRRYGPSREYVGQLGLYAFGHERKGKEVKLIRLVAFPSNKSSMQEMYVWEAAWDDEYKALVQRILADTEQREKLAGLVADNVLTLADIPATPDDSACTFCPLLDRRGTNEIVNGRYTGCPGKYAKN